MQGELGHGFSPRLFFAESGTCGYLGGIDHSVGGNVYSGRTIRNEPVGDQMDRALLRSRRNIIVHDHLSGRFVVGIVLNAELNLHAIKFPLS